MDAIDLRRPDYLGYEDIFFAGDLQQVVPELLALFKNSHKKGRP